MSNLENKTIAAVIFLLTLVLLGGCAGTKAEKTWGDGERVPESALYLLGKSRGETCPTCRAEMEKDAFAELSKALYPGRVFTGTFYMKEDGIGKRLVFGPLPSWVAFRFHVPGRRWVGIADSGLSDPVLARRVLGAGDGASFKGSVELVAYPYGEGPTFLWSRKSGILEVHCKLLAMDP